ncbi:MAG: GTPase Era [Thermoleophilaceae bacterium]
MTSRSGIIALAGRPNAGKSTLVNRIVGEKVAIVSDKPQTTRREIRGIATGEDWQLVLVDLPGVQRPRDRMTDRMQKRVEQSLGDADAVVFVLNGNQDVGAGDRYIARALRSSSTPAITVVNKIDRLDHTGIVKALTAAAALDVPGDVFPISARRGTGVGEVVEHLKGMLPEGPFLYPAAQLSDQSEQTHLAELVREQVLLRTRQELPHAVEAQVLEMSEREDGMLMIDACLYVEGNSQKGILVGRQGSMIKGIGTAARKEIEAATGAAVHLDLKVRVRSGWRGDDSLLDRLGIE